MGRRDQASRGRLVCKRWGGDRDQLDAMWTPCRPTRQLGFGTRCSPRASTAGFQPPSSPVIRPGWRCTQAIPALLIQATSRKADRVGAENNDSACLMLARIKATVPMPQVDQRPPSPPLGVASPELVP